MFIRKTLAFVLCFALVTSATPPLPAFASSQTPNLRMLVERSYLELLNDAYYFRFSAAEVEAFRKILDEEKSAEQDRVKAEELQLKRDLDRLKDELSRLNAASSSDNAEQAAAREKIHCQTFDLEDQIRELRAEREFGVGVKYDNRLAKLDLVASWRETYGRIRADIAAGRARERPNGNVEDIGVRDLGDDNLAEHQQRDIQTGEDAVRELRSTKLLPPEVEDEAITDFVQEVANRIARNSDLKVPVRVSVFISDEINAFSLPGGYVFVNAGLIARAENESELAGVLAHEIAHAAARHGPKLMRRATIANIFFQAAQVAALVLTGGTAGLAAYYGLQYGFFGLGMVLELSLLGVNREYEAEADQLGAQYAWASGYDPAGFITFFDKMATDKGYVRAASFFRTHPPFFDRIMSTFSEIEYLPPKQDLMFDSSSFQDARKAAETLLAEDPGDGADRPTLRDSKCPV